MRTNHNLPNATALCSVGSPSALIYTGGALGGSGLWTWTCIDATAVSCEAYHIYCGDGLMNNVAEQCDDGNAI